VSKRLVIKKTVKSRLDNGFEFFILFPSPILKNFLLGVIIKIEW